MTTQSMYTELYRTISEARGLSRRRVALDSELYHSKLIRILDKGGKAEFDVMASIGEAIGADPIRAAIAIEVLHDPTAYFRPTVRVVSGLLTSLVKELNQVDERLFEGFIDQEVAGLISLLITTIVPALERRDRRITFL